MILEYIQGCFVLIFDKTRRNKFITAKKTYLSQIWILAIPLLMENTLQILLGTVDRYFASSLDNSAIAAIGVTEIIMNIYLSFFIAVNVGVSVALGRNIGKKDIKQAGEVTRQGIILSGILGTVVGLVSIIFGRQLLLFTGCTNEILTYALPYFCRWLSLLFFLAYPLRFLPVCVEQKIPKHL